MPHSYSQSWILKTIEGSYCVKFHPRSFSDDLLPDFHMDLEIYYTVLTTENCVPSLRAPRPSISIRGSSRRQAHFSAPKFCLAGHVQLTVDDVKGCMVSKDLAMGKN